MTGTPDAVVKAAAKGLWDHRELNMVAGGYECYCGERISEGYAIAPSLVAHGKHQARAVLAAAEGPWREHLAQAWDEAVNAMSSALLVNHHIYPECFDRETQELLSVRRHNPYRLEAGDEFQDSED